MANVYVYGRQFSITYFPVDLDGNPVTASADAPTIYLFGPDFYPSQDTARSGTNALQTISSWSASGNGYQFTVGAIDDSNPSDPVGTRDYHFGINFTTEASEQVQTRRLHIRVSRPLGYDEELNVVQADLEAYFPTIDNWIATSAQDTFISEATSWVKSRLEDKNYNYYLVTNPTKLKFLVIQRALNRIALAQVATGNQGFQVLLEETKDEVESEFKSMILDLDTDQDGEKDEETSIGGFIRLMV